MEVRENSQNDIKDQNEMVNKKKKLQGSIKKRFFSDAQWKVITSLFGIGLVNLFLNFYFLFLGSWTDTFSFKFSTENFRRIIFVNLILFQINFLNCIKKYFLYLIKIFFNM